MVISVNFVREYKPEWNGNKDDPNPIIVMHKAPTMELADQLIPKPTIVMKTGKDGVDGGEMEVTIDNRKFVRAMVTSIRNLSVEFTDVQGVPVKRIITSAEELMAPGVPSELQGLVDELGTYFQKLLSKKDLSEKNSE